MKLIDADALIKELTDFADEQRDALLKQIITTFIECGIKVFADNNELDAVAVVRCKNCIYKNTSDCFMYNNCRTVNDDYAFCSNGKENEST